MELALEDKENEITAIAKLLDKPDVEGAVISIDAIGTQTDIAARILDMKAHTDKKSIREGLFLASLDDDYLLQLINNVKF